MTLIHFTPNFKVHLLNTLEPSKLCNLRMKMRWMLENTMKTGPAIPDGR